MTVTDIYEAMNSKAEAFFEWLQAHPKYGLLFGVGLLALWLAGLLFRWKWACHWQFNSKLWLFDDCKPETRRRVQIVLVSVLIILILVGYGVFRHEVMVKWAKYIIFVMIWIRTIANTGSASSTICGM